MLLIIAILPFISALFNITHLNIIMVNIPCHNVIAIVIIIQILKDFLQETKHANDLN